MLKVTYIEKSSLYGLLNKNVVPSEDIKEKHQVVTDIVSLCMPTSQLCALWCQH